MQKLKQKQKKMCISAEIMHDNVLNIIQGVLIQDFRGYWIISLALYDLQCTYYCSVKKAFRYSRPQPGCHLPPNSP
jgi:hypothetical protein